MKQHFWEMMEQVMVCGMWAALPDWRGVVVRLNPKTGEMALYSPATEQWLAPYAPTTSDLYSVEWQYVRPEAPEKSSGQ